MLRMVVNDLSQASYLARPSGPVKPHRSGWLGCLNEGEGPPNVPFSSPPRS